ncbi:hypothetical protein [Pararhodobacter sp. SW119]|uniref:hypothetical protein n=1 Tax=Pararhodobacter sp. SW119 TaxID=2780075 RepID=UPI001ADFAC7D|nr:hypothetical protein [Pararhodobacter sp. SW119]
MIRIPASPAFRPLLALACAGALLAGCARPDAPQAPRLLSPAEIAALTADTATAPEQAASDEAALAARAAALRVRAAALRTGS